MTDAPEPAEFEIDPPRRSFWRNLSLVWMVPILAIAVSAGIALKAWSERGVLIQIAFQNASGVTPRETTIRHRDVVIGTVEAVQFSVDLTNVVVSARVNQEIAPFLDEDAQFWVVRPEVTTRGITGLNTVLSGVYIEGAWDTESGEPQRQFTGFDDPPLAPPGVEGRRITLRSEDGEFLTAGAPVFFRGIEVGRLDRPRLTLTGESIVIDAFIFAPHDRRLSTATRFWDTSGFNVSFGPEGLSLNVESLASLWAGGIAFEDIYEGGDVVGEGYVFDIYPDEADARRSLFAPSVQNAVTVAVAFGESISGLKPGAAVEFNGLRVGQVDAIAARLVGESDVRLVANLSIEPAQFGLPPDSDRAAVLDFLEGAVADGLRARLATASLLTASLIVELVTLEDTPPAEFDREAVPLPQIPTVPSDLPDFIATAEGVLERLNKLPIEEVMNAAISLLRSTEELVSAESTRDVPEAAVALLEETRALVNDASTKALPAEIRGAVEELRGVVADLRESGAVEKLAAALEQAGGAAANVATATEEVPALIEDLRALAAKANALEAEELVAAATRVLDSADAVIGTEEARALPPALTAALEEVRATIAELRQGGVVENLASALERADAAAANIATASEGVPQLVEDLRAVAAKANSLEAEELIAAATRVLDSADALIGTEEARAVPPALRGALDEVRATLQELREGGVVENANATMASARDAADAVAEAATGLPALSARLERLVSQAEGLVASYGARSDFNDETIAALREVRGAARAVAQLARTIERNPQSLLTGR